MSGSRRHTVAIVDDEVQLRQLYSAVLADEYRIREADSGEAALEMLDEDVDVLLLDRQMAGLSGEDVLRQLREAGSDVPVAMVTANVPDFDVLELGVDDYVVKPVEADELREVIQTLLLRREYGEVVREYYALASKLSALRASKPPAELASDERFARAEERLAEIRRRASRSLETMLEAGKFEDVVRESASTD